ncbi:LOW QUALITY PROTEIN: reverse transcriptase [Phytophthora megakarya]|uniref:Reverse transcriptase n=1 Tax=Phytophthora megakarya TaxID=4795 RepID=A0A225VZE1_9STRA|nr:LOW QUALITY PROTEIN: reverse transcriptase [Phytophthora megakarya]
MYKRVDKLLDVGGRWNLSISVAKSYWGRCKVAYLGHKVSAAGLEANPTELDLIANLPFPTKLKAMHCFMEDFAVYAAILYELREADFHEITRMNPEGTRETRGDDGLITGASMIARAKNAFTMLKAKSIATTVLKHFDPERIPVILLYANKWAISAALMQEHEGVYHPGTFTSRTLKANELNYGVVDKELLALLSIKVLSRFSTLAWLLKSNGFDDRLGRWAALLSGWTLEVTKCVKDEEEIIGTIAASITPRADVDEALVAIAPKKQPRKMITMPPPTRIS